MRADQDSIRVEVARMTQAHASTMAAEGRFWQVLLLFALNSLLFALKSLLFSLNSPVGPLCLLLIYCLPSTLMFPLKLTLLLLLSTAGPPLGLTSLSRCLFSLLSLSLAVSSLSLSLAGAEQGTGPVRLLSAVCPRRL